MNYKKNISIVFSTIIFLLIGLGMSSLFYLKSIAEEAENLYIHPYSVSNASRNVSINLISMHRYMKDVVLAENESQILVAKQLVDKHEQQVQNSFRVIFDRYLGDPKEIEIVFDAFIAWKKIRDEVVLLKIQGKNHEAAYITKNKGAEHVALLNSETQKLIDFADNKAKTFFNNTVEKKNNALTIVISFFVMTVIVSLFIARLSLKQLESTQIEINNRMYLIDQNILIANFDQEGVVVNISNKLCRYLGFTKEDVLGEKLNFFVNPIEGNIQVEDILLVASTGKTWEGEIQIKNAVGDIKWIHSSVYPELDKNKVINGYSNIIYDVSDKKALEKLSITDSLTKLYNRRHFDQVLEKEISITRRNRVPLILVIIDIDYFKKYNDHYGHPAGDRVLMNVAQVFIHSLKRPNDFVFRLGGEEFGLVMSGNTPNEMYKILGLIKDKIENLNIEHLTSDVNKYLTISIGAHISTVDSILDMNQLYIQADEALYKAKLQRNTIVIT